MEVAMLGSWTSSARGQLVLCVVSALLIHIRRRVWLYIVKAIGLSNSSPYCFSVCCRSDSKDFYTIIYFRCIPVDFTNVYSLLLCSPLTSAKCISSFTGLNFLLSFSTVLQRLCCRRAGKVVLGGICKQKFVTSCYEQFIKCLWRIFTCYLIFYIKL